MRRVRMIVLDERAGMVCSVLKGWDTCGVGMIVNESVRMRVDESELV